MQSSVEYVHLASRRWAMLTILRHQYLQSNLTTTSPREPIDHVPSWASLHGIPQIRQFLHVLQMIFIVHRYLKLLPKGGPVQDITVKRRNINCLHTHRRICTRWNLVHLPVERGSFGRWLLIESCRHTVNLFQSVLIIALIAVNPTLGFNWTLTIGVDWMTHPFSFGWNTCPWIGLLKPLLL